jgi:hypothetical protein
MAESKDAPGTAKVSLEKVVEEFDLLLNPAWTAYLNRRTGETFTVTDEDELALRFADDPELADRQEEHLPKVREVLESPDWTALPSRYDFHEYNIMARFCHEVADEGRHAALLDAIRGRGAFRRFKTLVHRYGIHQQWYDYRDREVERFIADWLEAEGIPYEK